MKPNYKIQNSAAKNLDAEQFDFDGYDLIISTSHCAAKSVVVPGRAVHVCYCHSPMRYAWDQFDDAFARYLPPSGAEPQQRNT